MSHCLRVSQDKSRTPQEAPIEFKMITFKHTLSLPLTSASLSRVSLSPSSSLFCVSVFSVNEYVNVHTGITIMDGLLDYPGAQAAVNPKTVHLQTGVNRQGRCTVE